jgi:hypothetical protein
VLAGLARADGESGGRPILRARFVAIQQPPAGTRLSPGRPTFPGILAARTESAAGIAVPSRPGPELMLPQGTPVTTTGGDVFIADGSEEAVGVNPFDGRNLVVVYNQGFLNTSRMKTSVDGNVTWTTDSFPNGTSPFSGYTYDPWASPGNSNGVLFTSLIRTSSTPGSNEAHVVVARSSDHGITWPKFFEATRTGMHDRAMFDVDRSAALGGGSGSTHDGKVYLDYDLYSISGSYMASYFQTIAAAGMPRTEIQISDATQTGFDGYQIQPVAGIADGQIYLMGNAVSVDGLTNYLVFHEVTGAGASIIRDKSFISFPAVGQPLGTSGRIGLNGHRINGPSMDIDRSNGPRRGTLYVVLDSNPNPTDPTLDQGDVQLLKSTDGGSHWTGSVLPGLAADKTQYFSMIDVDDDGWIHIAYYQNETGSTDGGVLNASTANVYYTVSNDGGLTWVPHTRVNDTIDTLNMFDPPLDLSAVDYYMIGDYAQVQAGFVSGARVAHVCFAGFDKNRDNVHFAQKRDRVLCTTVTPPLDSDGDGVFDSADNCPDQYNPNQRDTDGDGVGDACQNFPADVNVDDTGSSQKRIDGSDLFVLARAFGACLGDAPYDARVDLTFDDCVDGYDLALMASVWGVVLP